MKKYLKIAGITLAFLLVLAMVLPYFFKDRIMDELKKALNKNINGNIEFKDASVSLFKNFPKLTLSVDELICKSYVNQDTSLLFQASEIQLGFNLWTIISNKEKLTITKMVFSKPIINIIEYDSLLVNYNIMKPTEPDSSKSSTALSMDIQSYEINEGTIQYISNVSGMKVNLKQINHSGSLYYSDELTKIKTKTEIQEIDYQKNKVDLLKSLKLNSNLDFDYQKKENRVNLSRFEFNLNNLKLECLGSFASNGDSLLLDLDLKTPGNQFKDIFSILPNAYTKDFAQVKSDGKFQLEAKLNGVYSSIQKIYPSWKFTCNINNGFLHYPGKSLELEKFNLDLLSQNTGPALTNSMIDLKTFSFMLNKQAFNGNLLLSNLDADLSGAGKLNGILNLSDLNNFYPLPESTKISGFIKPDFSFHFTQSAINNKQYDQIDCAGTVIMTDINYHTKGQPDISVQTAELKLSAKQLELKNIALKFGQSDMKMEGMIDEPLNFVSKDQEVTGHLTASSNLLNLKEWMTVDTMKLKSKKKVTSKAIPNYISKLNINVNCDVAQMMYSDYDIRNSKAYGVIQGNTVKIDQVTLTINQNQINGNGKLTGIYSFMMNDQILSGDLQILAKQFDADKFMAKPVANNANGMKSPVANQNFIVPKNFNIHVGFKSDEIVYKPLKLMNVLGKLVIVNDEIQFEDMGANLAGGKISLKGIYNTANPDKPAFNLKFDILKLQFSEAMSSFVSLPRLAPVMQYIQGSFNTNLILEGILGKDMFPILDEISVNGLFETLQGSIQGFKPLDALADKLKISGLKKLNIGNTKNWVSVKNGIVGIKDFNKKIEDIDVNINGNHKISGPMDYQFILKIPKAKVANFASALKLDHAVDQLNNLLTKSGIGGSVLTNINLLVNMTGTATQPSFGFKLLNDKGEVSSEQDQMKESIKTKIGDSINNRVEVEKAKAAGEIKKIQDSISKEAAKKAGELKNQVLDKAAKEAGKSLDSNIVNKAKESLDSLSQKVLNKDVKKEADQIKDKLKDWNPFKKDKK